MRRALAGGARQIGLDFGLVVKLPNQQYLDLAIEPLFAADPEETWSTTEDEGVLNDIMDMVEVEDVTYEFVTH